MKQFRHGDLLLQEISYLPFGCQTQQEDIILEGEATGHAHRLVGDAQLLMHRGDRFVQAHTGAAVIHEEHARIDLPAGLYQVVRQREYVVKSDLTTWDAGYRYVDD